MPLFDAKTLDNDFDGSALLASILFATPQAKADAKARGLARLASAGSLGEAMTLDATAVSESRADAASVPAA